MDDFRIPRTCTEASSPSTLFNTSLENFQQVDAYVLLGAPGSGKTTEFIHASISDPSGHFVHAQDFIAFDGRPEWHGKTLYIDGLDEVRAPNRTDPQGPLNQVLRKLERLGRPKFRLSCRIADWMVPRDMERLRQVAKDGQVQILLLDPLSEDGIHDLLRHHGIQQAEEFIKQACYRGMASLLGNPQSLMMLAQSMKQNDAWPNSRRETFERTCKELIREHNDAHERARNLPKDPLDAAGRMLAVQLLAGKIGYNLSQSLNDGLYVRPEQVSGIAKQHIVHLLNTPLFESDGSGRMMPVHRQFAEFLAGRHLAECVRHGMSLERLHALMHTSGGIAPNLRGTAAWLATHNVESRREIIRLDPLGVALYGDVRDFSHDEKCQLLDHLKEDIETHVVHYSDQYPHYLSPSLKGFDAPDMDAYFRDALNDPDLGKPQQIFVLVILGSLTANQHTQTRNELLLGIVRDARRYIEVREKALDVCIQNQEGHERILTDLLNLLHDIDDKQMDDPGDRLLSRLLTELYPNDLSPQDILRYFRDPPPARKSTSSHLVEFWEFFVPDQSTPVQLAELLDGIANQIEPLTSDSFRDVPVASVLRDAPAALLAKFLKISPEHPEPERLFRWLGIAWGVLSMDSNSRASIQQWLRGHPSIYESLFRLGVEQCVNYASDWVQPCIHQETYSRLFEVRHPNYKEWCGKLSRSWIQESEPIGKYFLAEFLGSPPNVSIKEAKQILGDNETLWQEYKSLSQTYKKIFQDEYQYVVDIEHACQERSRQWSDSVRKHSDALRHNQCRPEVLDRFAHVYFGLTSDVSGNHPKERLSRLLEDNEQLIESVLEGLRGTPKRTDLPSIDEIVRLSAQDRRHLLALPYLAGIQEMAHKSDPATNEAQDERKIGLALAIHYSAPARQYSQQMRDWLCSIQKRRPEMAADILARIMGARLRRHANFEPTLYRLLGELISNNCWKTLKLATLPLLKAFPARHRESELMGLKYLLKTALRYCERQPLLEIIDRKIRLAPRSTTVRQRNYWQAAGLFVSLNQYRVIVEQEVNDPDLDVARRERRIWHLSEFYFAEPYTPGLLENMDTELAQFLFRLIGPFRTPGRPPPDARILLDILTHRPHAENVLTELRADDSLSAWKDQINEALRQRQEAHRSDSSHQLSAEQVLAVLDNQEPVDASDLTAFVCEHLRAISKTIRDGNTDDWKQYWENPQGDAPKPKPETLCRNQLLSDLRYQLSSLNIVIDAQPEGASPGGRRADIRISYQGFCVPIEIKKSNHRELWNAIKNQLFDYAREPEADGNGIYVVLWLGNRERCPQDPQTGKRPETASNLETLLKGGLQTEHQRISICAIDVSIPE